MKARSNLHLRAPWRSAHKAALTWGDTPSHSPVPQVQNRHRRALAAAASITVGALALAGIAPAAAVPAEVGPGVAITGVMDQGTTWLGAVGGTSEAEATGWLSWCITAGLLSPQGTPATAASYVDDPQLAWIVREYEHVETDLSRAAIAYLAHTRHETGSSGVTAETRTARIIANTPQAVKDVAAGYLADGASKAGPYSASPGTVEGVGTRTGKIWVDPLTSSAGTAMVGLPMTVALDGPAVFDTNENSVADAGETPVWNGETPAERIALKWVATGNGEVTGTRTISNLPRTTLTRFDATGELQDTLTYGARSPSDPEEIIVPGPTFEAVADFQPEIRTTVATAFVDKGAALVDQVTVAAAAGDTWAQVDGADVALTAQGVLYGPYPAPPARSVSVPAGAPVAGTAELTFAGPSTQDAAASSVATRSGYYTWVWTIDKESQGSAADYVRADATHDFGLVAETHLVPFQPEVTTVVADRVVDPAHPLVDDVTFDVAPGDSWLTRHDGTPVETVWDGTLYGPYDVPTPEVDTAAPDAPVHARTTLTASGPGVQSTDPGATTGMTPGFYTWVWEMELARQPVGSQPYLADSSRTAFMVEDETSTMKHTGVVTTMVRDFNVVQGGQIHDTVTVSGLPDSHGQFAGQGGWVGDVDEIVHTAYGPLAEQPTDDLDLAAAPVLGTATTPARNGTYLIGLGGEFQVAADGSAAGWYVIVSSFAGDDRLDPFTTSSGDVMEMAFVPVDEVTAVESWLVTDADAEVPAGQPFKDTAHLTGTVVDGGHLRFEAYGPFTEDQAPAESTETLLWTSEQIPVSGAGTYRSGIATAELPDGAPWGDVYWVATYLDADGDEVVRGDFGDPSEITRLVPPGEPAVTTLATSAVSLGSPSHDVAYVSGPVVAGSTLSFAAYRQDAGADVALDELVVDTAEDPTTIYHGGTYESPEVTFDAVGTYYWVETLTGPDGKTVHVGEPRLPEETTQVVRVTTTAQPTVTAGDVAHDVALVEGTPPDGSTLGFEVFRQDDGDDPTLDVLVATLDPVEITGPETTSADVRLEAPGTYYWVETLVGPGGEVVHVGEARLPGETTTAAVEESQPEGGGALAVTGTRVVATAVGAAVLLVAGLTVTVARRRRAVPARHAIPGDTAGPR